MQQQEIESATLQTRIGRVGFTGQSDEFFKIWIVNILLTILTLGIYSAWAKVRTNQYLHGHTKLEGLSFRYLAKPLQILKGRLIAVAVFIGISVAVSFSPIAAGILYLLLLIATPWLIVQGLRFSLRMTSYRNIRFSFEGNYWGVVAMLMVVPTLIIIFTLGLGAPWAYRGIDKYIYENISFGGKRFSANTEVGRYYIAALASAGAVIAAYATVFILVIVAVIVFKSSADISWLQTSLSAEEGDFQPMIIGTIALFYLGTFILYFFAYSVYKAIVTKHLIQSLQIENIATFKTDMSTMSFVWLNLTNILLLVISLGLAYPVTVIRKRTFIANNMTVELTPLADTLVNTEEGQDAAFGEEAANLFDVDLSFT